MARRDLNVDEEKRSYAGLWLLCAGLLVVGAVWAIMDDTFLRRPWKAYQRAYFHLEEKTAYDALEQERQKLLANPEYVELQKQLDAANHDLATGESAKKLAAAESRLTAAQVREHDADLRVRFVKSELEEAWYEYDHAIESGGDVNAAKQRRDKLIGDKERLDADWKGTQRDLDAIQAEIAEIRSPAKTVETKMRDMASERERIETKIAGLKSNVSQFEVSRIPAIEQIVVPDFDKNNFEEPVSRVDRCTSCHVPIAKAGYEDQPNPMRTHPKLDPLIVKHPPEKFGCTSCHEGQGVALNSVKQAHGQVEFWEHPLLEGDENQSRCMGCHRDVSLIPQAATLEQGEYLFEQLGCHGCHLVQGYDDLPPVGPSLARVAAKDDPAWLVAWIQDPYQFRPRTKMPYFGFSPEQAKAVAAYIWTSSKADGDAWLEQHPDPGISGSDSAAAAKGKEIFDSVGCRACHAITPDEVATPLGTTKDWGPNLGRVGEKTSGRFLYWWVKNPHEYSPTTRMPSLRLTDDEARSVTAYLLSLSSRPEGEAKITAATLEDPQLAEQGKSLVRKYGCFGCHVINGMEAESRIGVELSTFGGKTLEELFFGNHTEIPRTWNDWTYNKLKDPRIYATEHVEQLMPNFHLADEDILALRVWLQSRVERIPPPKYRDPENDHRLMRVQQGRRVIQQYNCMGCHQIDGRGGYIRRLYQENPTSAPPILMGEGAKVQPEWLFGFLEDPSRQPLRFWLKVRMPTFGLDDSQRTKVVDYFGAVAKLKDPYFFWDPAIDSTPQQIAAGKRLMSDEFFSCWSCHVRGTETPGGPPEQWAPNLAYANGRLNPGWITRWIKNPQALMPGTKMPAFFEEGQPGPDEIFGGNVDQQAAAMRDYIMSLGWQGGATTQTADKDKRDGTGGSVKAHDDRSAAADSPATKPES